MKRTASTTGGADLTVVSEAELIQELGRRSTKLGRKVTGPQEVFELCLDIRNASKEHVAVFCLNAAHELIEKNIVSIGTLTESLVHPREVFRPAIHCGAAAIILAHNHPSGTCAPSSEDAAVTRRMKDAGTLLGIPMLDHVVVTANEWARCFP